MMKVLMDMIPENGMVNQQPEKSERTEHLQLLKLLNLSGTEM